MFERLFSPIRIRDMELENRVVMTGMGDPDGRRRWKRSN